MPTQKTRLIQFSSSFIHGFLQDGNAYAKKRAIFIVLFIHSFIHGCSQDGTAYDFAEIRRNYVRTANLSVSFVPCLVTIVKR